MLFLIEGKSSCQELFSEWKNIVPTQSYCFLKSRKYIQLHYTRELYCDSPKINFKIYLLLHFLSYWLETWKFCSRDQNETFDWVDFWLRHQKWEYRILKVACKLKLTKNADLQCHLNMDQLLINEIFFIISKSKAVWN